MSLDAMLWRLPSAAMTRHEDLDARRLGYWLRRVRLRRAAIAAGLAPTSGSTVSLWERAERPIKRVHLYRLAEFYRVDPAFFTHPQETDEERLDAALGDAGALEREDWEGGPA